MWIATMESENYSWHAYGKTKKLALQKLYDLWNKNADTYGREKMSLADLDDWYGIHTEECIEENSGWR